jgi:hypothetical protein
MTSSPLLRRVLVSGLALALVAPWAPAAAAAPPKGDVEELLRKVDARTDALGDYQALCVVQEKQKARSIVREMIVFRRKDGEKFSMLLTGPRAYAGSAVLRLDRNLWSFDPRVGRWDRHTQRDQVAGTNMRTSDFDSIRLAEFYEGQRRGEEKVGGIPAQRLHLKAKPGVDVVVAEMDLWIDESLNILKIDEFASGGKVVRTLLFSKYARMSPPGGGADVWYPMEVRVLDRVETERVTTVAYQKVDLSPIETGVFTKAWVESKSR